MTKCKVIVLTLSDVALPFLYTPHPFLYKVSVHQVSATTELILQNSCM